MEAKEESFRARDRKMVYSAMAAACWMVVGGGKRVGARRRGDVVGVSGRGGMVGIMHRANVRVWGGKGDWGLGIMGGCGVVRWVR